MCVRLGTAGVPQLPAQGVLVAGGGEDVQPPSVEGPEAGREGPWHAGPLWRTDAPGSASPAPPGGHLRFILPAQGLSRAKDVNALSLSLLTVCEANTHCPRFAEEEMGSEVTWLVSGH